MAETLRDVLLDKSTGDVGKDALEYLTSLTALAPSAIADTQPDHLANEAHLAMLSIHGLSKRSYKQLIGSALGHGTLQRSLPNIANRANELRTGVPRVVEEVSIFASTFGKSGHNERLANRKRALILARNVERSVDVMELPGLLSSALSVHPVNFSSALDIYGHIRRLQSLYPNSTLISGVSQQADDAIGQMAADLVHSLASPSIKLATSLRLVGWLRRVVPDIDIHLSAQHESQDMCISAVFLLCRIRTLCQTLEALAPLRDLADDERLNLERSKGIIPGSTWPSGHQSERYLKRYTEIFREQSFGIVSMFKAVFPSTSTTVQNDETTVIDDGLRPLQSPVVSFCLGLSDLLVKTISHYLPAVRDQISRDSILTQAMYCARSMGRLGADFGVLLADVESPQNSDSAEWIEVLRRHRLLAGRLESVIGSAREGLPG